ncbi:MAG: hypothetical protein Kow00128_20620 [Deltaproteobacteria bacterium]
MTRRPAEGPGNRIPVRVDPDLEDLIPGFLENRRGDLEAMREALGRGDFAAIRSLAHTLKGVGGGYGFDGITEISREIEESAGRGDLPATRRGIDRLSDYLSRVEVVFE